MRVLNGAVVLLVIIGFTASAWADATNASPKNREPAQIRSALAHNYQRLIQSSREQLRPGKSVSVGNFDASSSDASEEMLNGKTAGDRASFTSSHEAIPWATDGASFSLLK